MGLLSRQPSRVRAIKTRLYELIDRATSEYLSAPNFALNTDVVSAINGAPDPGYAAAKACKRIRGRLVLKNPRVQQLALQLLENCVRSCGEVFHRELAKSELFVELLRMADRSSWCTAQLQTQVLALLQEWAYILKPAQFSNAYNRLKGRGLPFPPRDAAPKFEPYPGLSPPPPPPTGQHYIPHGHPAEDVAPPVAGPPQLLSASQPPAKLREDMDVAANTITLMEEMLDGVPPDNFGAAKEEYVLDMVAQCREMKDRLTQLISRLSDESLMAAALQLNDDAQAALDRHSDMVAVAEGRRRPPPPPQPAARPPPAAPQRAQQQQAAVTVPAPPASNSAAAAGRPAASKPPPPLLDLLSLDAWGPEEAAPSYPPVSTVMGSSTTEGDPFVLATPAAAAAPVVVGRGASNNPFAPQAQPPPQPTPPSAATPAIDSTNPFLNDTVFAAAAQPQPAPPAQPSPTPSLAAWAGAAQPSAAAQSAELHTGNPFAAPVATELPPEPVVTPSRQPAVGSYPPAEPSPPPPQATGSFSGYAVLQSPLGVAGAPLYSGSTLQGSIAGSTYSSSPFGPDGAGTPPPIHPGPYGRPLSDAFGDLVSLTAKEEPAQLPPPRGTPMRTLVGLSPEPSDATASVAANDEVSKSGLSAFDAFDELITNRGSATPSRGTSAT